MPIEVAESKPATIEIVKGSRAFPTLPKGLTLAVRFEAVTRTSPIEREVAEKSVRVHFGRLSISLAGNRVKIPELASGREFNLHNGNPHECVRIRIA